MKPILCIAAALALSGQSLPAGTPEITEAELVRRTQELFDAVVPGNQTPWKKHFADDCIYHDEKGRSLNKTQLVADIKPLPRGYSGSIKVKNVESRMTKDSAVLSYDTDETETIFGQELHAHYHEIDTWLRRNDQWQIVASQAFRYYEDPAMGKADTGRAAGYSGSYVLSKDSPRRTVISSEGDKLFLQRTGGAKTELFPEASDIFFRKGVEGRILFRTGASGNVELVDRRNNEDVVWRKEEAR